MIEAVILILAALALLAIAFEEVIHFNKAKSTLFLGCVSWLLLFIHAKHQGTSAEIQEQLNENLLDIASLWLFLMATMTFVAYLNARGLVSELVRRMMPGQLSLRQLTFLLGFFALFLSMICDNITATLVGVGAVQAFQLSKSERIRLCVLIVFAVNSGGVMLITGDVTTLMIFSAGHVSIQQLLTLFIPSFAGVLLLAVMFGLSGSRKITAESHVHEIEWLDLLIASIFICTIVATIVLNILFVVPPVLTFLLGLSMMFMVGGIVHTYNQQIHMLDYVRQIQFDTLMFFLGILLLVGALKEIGVLIWFTEFYMAVDPNYSSYAVGVISALLDNVPLTAALLKSNPDLTSTQWLSLTYAVGVGGSMLVIGSASGIVAMSKVKDLSFIQYARYLPHLLLAYTTGYGLTLLL